MHDIYSNEITEQFLKRFCDLDMIKKDPKYTKFCVAYEKRIKSLTQIRNLATHESKEGGRPFLISKFVLSDLEDILFRAQTKCFDVGTRKSNIIYVKKEDSLDCAIRLMVKNNYSFLPILDNDFKILGVISEKSIVNIINKYNGEFIYDKTIKVEDNLDEFLIGSNPDECYLFVAKSELLDNIRKYINYGKGGKRFGACFVTENGKERESLISMFTIWDVIALDARQ